MFTLIALLAFQTLEDFSGQQVVHLFTPHEYHLAEGRFKGQVFNYRLFEPEITDFRDRFPIIVWLHGEGESGVDNIVHLRWLGLIFNSRSDRSEYPFFVLVVQKPANEPWSIAEDGVTTSPDDMLSVVASILALRMKDLPIDPDRVYVSGVSSGGTACWELGIRHPERYAAIAPLACAGADLNRVHLLKNVSVRAFHSSFDTISSPQSARHSIETLVKTGGNASLVEIESNRHDCWTAAFGKYDLLNWLLLQERGRPTQALTFLNRCEKFIAKYALTILIPVIVAIVWHMENRRRRRPTAGIKS